MMIRLGLFWSALLLAAGVFLFEGLPPFLLPYGYALLLLSGVLFLLYGHFRGRFSLVLLGAALSLLTIGAFRMALSDALWQEQSHWASRSAGTYEGIVMEEPLVQKGRRAMRDMRLRSFPSDTPMGRSSRSRGRATSMIRRRPGISIPGTAFTPKEK